VGALFGGLPSPLGVVMASRAIGGKGTQTWGEYQMRIPENDYHTLMVLIPELNSKDKDIREKAWKQFAESPLANAYRMVRAPSEVKRSNNNKIIVR
jgi:hypothetical protein